MTLDNLVEKSFVGTTIDAESLRSFVKDSPNYLGWGFDCFPDEVNRDLLNRADYFEFHYQRYLLGLPKTLHRVLYEVRMFQAVHPEQAPYFLRYSIEVTKRSVMAHEFYELMPRLEKSARKIKSILPYVVESISPLLLELLKLDYPGHAASRRGDAQQNV